MRVAIMQPTFIPWLGYFGLMEFVDIFVFLDNVQFDKRSWQQSNKIKSGLNESKLTVPVFSKGKKDQLIKDVNIDTSSLFRNKHLKTIKQNYQNSDYFSVFYPMIENVYNTSNDNLCDFNSKFIKMIKNYLEIKTQILYASKLNVRGTKANLLAEICRSLGAIEYISPLTSKVYLDLTSVFQEKKIEIKYFDYKHPSYSQMSSNFISHLSVIDLIFNCGSDSLKIIKNGINLY